MKMTSLTFSDLDEVVLISAESFSPPWPKEAFASELSRSVTSSLALRDAKGRVVAYVLYWVLLREAHIVSIATAHAHRRKGYAEDLLRTLLRTPGVDECFLEVRASNHAAIQLYEKLKFERFDLRKRYYSDGEDGVVMRWPLSDLSTQ